MIQISKICLAAILCTSLAGCWNGENVHVDLGTVSIGQQLLDLKTAADAGAMSQEEYQMTREKILSLVHGCGEQSERNDADSAERNEEQAALPDQLTPNVAA